MAKVSPAAQPGGGTNQLLPYGLAIGAVALAAALTVLLGSSLGATPLALLNVAVLIVATVALLVRVTVRSRLRQAEIERLNRLYSALSRVSRAIASTPDREQLFREVCQALVERGGFQMAWIGWYEAESRRLVPVASWGDADGYLTEIQVFADDRPEGRGPAGTAFRSDRPVISNHFLTDPAGLPWRAEASRRRFGAAAAFPIRLSEAPCGTLNVVAMEPGFFRTREVELLEEVASDVSFALGNLAREQQREQAEAEAHRDRQLIDTVFESVPGVLFLYDPEDRFLRWNRHFLTVSGFTHQELSNLRPIDLIQPDDRIRLADRVGQVFASGVGAVEAGLRAKDGTITPYYFTGRRVDLDGRPLMVGIGVDISERIRAEADLRRSEERYHSTLENIMEGCQLIGFDWRYLYLNEAAATQTRRPRSELLGRTIPECWPGIETRVFAVVRRCLEERVHVQEEVEFVFSEGGSSWFDLRAEPVPEGAFLLSIDVSAGRQAEADAREMHRRFEVVVEHLSEGLVIADPNLDLLYWNPTALHLIGFSDAEEGRRHQREFDRLFELSALDGRPLPAADWPLARVRRGESLLNLALRVRRRDITWDRIISYTGTRVSYSDGRMLAFVTLQDITDRIEAEAERTGLLTTEMAARHEAQRSQRELLEIKASLERKVEERTGELRQALALAEGSDQLKSAFLATMSHELRTPLNSIIGFTGIVLQELAGPLTPEQAKQLGMVRRSARHLLDLINDVLDLTKIEAGQMALRLEAVDLRGAVERAAASVRPMAEHRALELHVVLPAELPPVWSDLRRVSQVLLNLLNNGVKFTEQGWVRITVEVGPAVTLKTGRPAARILVTDTGPGIKPADLPTLFQPFRQLDTGLARYHEGTGLGLAICRRLTDLLGGEIQVESTWGVGTTLAVTLPLQPGV